MRSAPARTAAALAVAALLTSCSSGDGGDAPEAPKGLTAAQACGGFAKDTAATAALNAVLGGDRFEDNLSKPEKAVAALRADAAAPWADAYRPQPVTYCGLRPEAGGEKDLKIQVNAAEEAPEVDTRLADKATYFAAGLRAYSSSSLGKLYFSCRLKAPAHEIVVETSVWGPADAPETDEAQRTRLITLANAAARDVSAKLGCEGDGLGTGVPAPAAKSS
ncbi:hypothetical protein ACFU8I_24080 [Streptomyces sp. NPDC057540]|uniref:hypothetical protein n=1 Tax=Streptomyces sp. NPDC057540 TaxID=3346160 RepID=UPI0036AA7F51